MGARHSWRSQFSKYAEHNNPQGMRVLCQETSHEVHSVEGRKGMEDRLLLRVLEVARLIGFEKTKTYQLIREGRIRSVLVDGRIRVPLEAVQDFVHELERSNGNRPARTPSSPKQRLTPSPNTQLVEWAPHQAGQGRSRRAQPRADTS